MGKKPLANLHTHLREKNKAPTFLKLALEGGARALGPMPNTEAGLTTSPQVWDYISVLQNSLADGLLDKPGLVELVPIVQITESTTVEEIERCVSSGILDGKIYPKDRTTKSQLGVSYYHRLLPVVKRAGELGMRIHFHPEHPDLMIDNRDAEFQFISVVKMFLAETQAVLIWEHATDARLIPFWEEWAKTGRFFVTITAHHLLEDENTTLGYTAAICKPTYKTRLDRYLLLEFVKKDHSWVMAIGDDAPHDKKKKQMPGPCACGAYTAPFLLPLFAHALEDLLQTPKGQKVFENFTNNNATRLYHLDQMEEIELVREPFVIPLSYHVDDWEIEPFWAGRTILYSIKQ